MAIEVSAGSARLQPGVATMNAARNAVCVAKNVVTAAPVAPSTLSTSGPLARTIWAATVPPTVWAMKRPTGTAGGSSSGTASARRGRWCIQKSAVSAHNGIIHA